MQQISKQSYPSYSKIGILLRSAAIRLQMKLGYFQPHQVFTCIPRIQQRKHIQIAQFYLFLNMQIRKLLLFQLSSHLTALYLIFTENDDYSVCQQHQSKQGILVLNQASQGLFSSKNTTSDLYDSCQCSASIFKNNPTKCLLCRVITDSWNGLG